MKKGMLFLLFILSGFAAFSQSSDPKTMAVPDGKAIIYVVRPEAIGSAIGMIVTINGEVMGATKGKNYIYKVVDPGTYSITWKVTSDAPEPVSVQAEAGKKYYVWQDVRMGPLFALCSFALLNEQEGLAKLQKCKLAKSPKE